MKQDVEERGHTMTSPAPLWSKERIWEYLERDAFWMSVDDGDNRGLLIYIGDAHADVQVICNDYEADRAAAAQREQALRQQRDELIEAVKWAYRKHHFGDTTIGWDELSEKLLDTLSNAMGVEELVKWQEGDDDD